MPSPPPLPYFFFLRLDAARRDGFGGTFAPFSRASDRPMAMACLRLFTVRPLRPLLSVPRLRRRIADSTVFCAFFPYFRGMDSTSCLSRRAAILASLAIDDSRFRARSRRPPLDGPRSGPRPGTGVYFVQTRG